MALKQNQSEGKPTSMFNMTVELGDGGVIGKVNIGIDASKVIQTLDYVEFDDRGYATERSIDAATNQATQVRYRGPRNSGGGLISEVHDNIVFINGTPSGTSTDTTGLGIYADLITTGMIEFRDTVYAGNVYFVGQDTGIDGNGPSQNQAALRDYNGNAIYRRSYTSGGVTNARTDWSNRQYGNLYFWGSRTPITSQQTDHNTFSLYGINSINLIQRNNTGFEGMTIKYESGKLFTDFSDTVGEHDNEMVVNYDTNISNISNWESYAGSYASQFVGSDGYNPIGTSLNSYLIVQDDAMNTAAKVRDYYLPNGVEAFEDAATELDIGVSSIGSGNYYLSRDNAQTSWNNRYKYYCLNHEISINSDNLSSPIVILIDGVRLVLGENTIHDVNHFCGFKMNGDNDTDNAKVIFILVNGGQIFVGPDALTSVEYHPGIIDTHCFKGANYYDITKLDQTTIPRFYIFGLDPNNNPGSPTDCPVAMTSENAVLTSFIGLFPQTTPRGGGGGVFGYGNTSLNTIYYGRISCGSFKYAGGTSLNIPYCPSIPEQTPNRPYAYRDNTDYSVVVEECGFYTA